MKIILRTQNILKIGLTIDCVGSYDKKECNRILRRFWSLWNLYTDWPIPLYTANVRTAPSGYTSKGNERKKERGYWSGGHINVI